MTENVKRGILVGLFFAAAYSLYVVVLYLLRGAEPFEAHHTTLPRVLGAYLFGGTTGGAIVGLLQPLIRNRITAIGVGILAALFVSLGLTIATNGLFSEWRSPEWITIAIMSILFGSYGGLYFWRSSSAG